MSVQCPQLTRLLPETIIITEHNIQDLIVSSFDRSVGTTVTVKCRPEFRLTGPSEITCQSNGAWSGNPSCRGSSGGRFSTESPNGFDPNTGTNGATRTSGGENKLDGDGSTNIASTIGGMDQDELAIIIGSSVACFIVLVVLICLIFLLCCDNRRTTVRYRDSEYKDDRSYRPYSINGKKPVEDPMPMYNMSTHPVQSNAPNCGHCPHCSSCHTPAPPPPKIESHHCHHCQSCCHHCESPKTHQSEFVRQIDTMPHFDYVTRFNSRPPSVHGRRFDSLPRSIQRFETDNDARDIVVRRDIIRDDGEHDRYNRSQRRDGYLWRGMYDAGWTIPRPIYD